MTRFRLTCIGSLATAALLCGCPRQSISIERKRQYAIQHVTQAYVNGRSPILKQWGHDILGALSSTNGSRFITPEFASATLGVDRAGECNFYVFWLEDTPAVDEVELEFAKQSPSAIMRLSAPEKEENAKASNASLVMVGHWKWLADDKAFPSIAEINDVSELRVRLLAGSAPVTGWRTVPFYRLDRWMGSKEITKVTSGKAGSGVP